MKRAQITHESRIRELEAENEHLIEENERIKGAIAQVKSAQTAMTERLRRLFLYFMRYYVRDEKTLEDTLRSLTDGSFEQDSLLPQQRQVMNSLLQLKNDGEESEEVFKPITDDELTKNHSLMSPYDQTPILLKPFDRANFVDPKYQSFSNDLTSHIEKNDENLRRIDTLTSQLQDVDNVLSDSLLDDELSMEPDPTDVQDADDDDHLVRS